MMKLIHRRTKCIGCNACVEAAPDRWRISKKDGKSVLVGGKEKKGIFMVTIHEWEWKENFLAMKNCPVKIIEISY